MSNRDNDPPALDVEPLTGDTAYAWMEKTPYGPKLLVAGVVVRWWLRPSDEGEAQAMAATIDEAIKKMVTRRTASAVMPQCSSVSDM